MLQAFSDDTAELKAAIETLGGLHCLQNQQSLRLALQAIDPFLSEVIVLRNVSLSYYGHAQRGPVHALPMPLQVATPTSEELVRDEFADWEAEHTPGGHWTIRNTEMRLFWWTAFAGRDETTWERFWGSFPKRLRNKYDCAVQLVSL